MLNLGKSFRQSKERIKKRSQQNYVYDCTKSINLLIGQDPFNNALQLPLKEIISNNAEVWKKQHRKQPTPQKYFKRGDRSTQKNSQRKFRNQDAFRIQNPSQYLRAERLSPSFNLPKYRQIKMEAIHRSSLSKDYIEIPAEQIKQLIEYHQKLKQQTITLNEQLTFFKKEYQKQQENNSVIRALI